MRYLVIIFFIFCSGVESRTGFSQAIHSSSNKALRAYNEGITFYDYFDFKNAEINFKIAITTDNNFYEAYLMLGDLMSKQMRFSEAITYYKEAVKIDSTFYIPLFFSLAEVEFRSGHYESALLHYKVYLGSENISEKNRLTAQKKVKNCEFALDAMKNPVPFNPVSIGDDINSVDDEYWPSITADGHKIMFTRQNRPSKNSMGTTVQQEDFYTSYQSENGWQKAVNAGYPINTSQNEGAQALSSAGNYMFFTACNRAGGMGSCDLYFSAYDNDRWSVPVNLGSPVNSSSWESQPSISADDQMLFFSSNRPGGLGGKDIWYSVLSKNNKWTTPVNMGSTINTEGDEMSPFIHFDGRTLYFASDGRSGMGGFDIYFSRMNEDSTWTTPKNLGYPINTYNDEMGLVIDASGQYAYFSSKRDDINGKDIFYFPVDESIRPDPVSYLRGKVYDKETGRMLKADYELINLSLDKVTVKSSSDSEGNFLVCLPSGYNYGLNISKAGYLFHSENFVFEGIHSVKEPYIKRINLSPVKIGEMIQLSNVFYELDSWELKKESISELDKLVSLLTVNNDIVIEIGGYTDATGTDEYNFILSEKRAKSVVTYLTDNGISLNRLKSKGYGNQLPVGDNITSEGRKLNRRTEVKIVDRIK